MEPAAFPFGDFLDILKQQGFSIGIDHYLRLQTVLNLLGPDCGPADLKRILCPIFAVNDKQQQLFRKAFDGYFRFWPRLHLKKIKRPDRPGSQTRATKSPKVGKSRPLPDAGPTFLPVSLSAWHLWLCCFLMKKPRMPRTHRPSYQADQIELRPAPTSQFTL